MALKKTLWNTFALYVNTYKVDGDKKSEYFGIANIDGVDHHLYADMKIGKKGEYLKGRTKIIWNNRVDGIFTLYKFAGKEANSPQFRGFMTLKKYIVYDLAVWTMKMKDGNDYMSGAITIVDPEMRDKGKAMYMAASPMKASEEF